MEKVVEIYFSDLSEEKQQEILEAYGMKDASEGNWDVLPLTQIDITTEE